MGDVRSNFATDDCKDDFFKYGIFLFCLGGCGLEGVVERR